MRIGLTRWLGISMVLVAVLGCTTSHKVNRKPKKNIAKHQNLSLDRLVSEDTLPTVQTNSTNEVIKTTKPKTKPLRYAPNPSKRVDACRRLVKRFVPPYTNLSHSLPLAMKSNLDSLGITLLNEESCETPANRRNAVNTILSMTDKHTQRIALLLPLTGTNADLAKHILDGLKAAFNEAKLSFADHVIVKDTMGTPQLTEQKLAEAVFVDQVSTVIGGLNRGEDQVLAKWGDLLFLTTMLVSSDTSLTKDSAFAFRIYPDEMRLGATLAEIAQKNQFKKIAVLRPSNRKSDQLIQHFRSKVEENKGRIVYDLIYQPDNFDSMERATRQLFQMDLAKRGEEYRRAYKRAQRRALQAGMPFDPRHIAIDPIIDFDAIFIPDDFRIVRHFSKLFKYHGARPLPMLGNHEWRSPALVQPPDPYIEGSYFADFIGSYQKLPSQVGAPTVGSPFFIKPTNVIAVDFRLIGYRTGLLVRQVIQARVEKRRHIASYLEQLPSTDSSLFNERLVFGSDHVANWPTYVFRVRSGTLTLDGQQYVNHPRMPQRKKFTLR